VKVGDILAVRAGEQIPVDGTVVAGHGSVDQSALTGESVPVEKSVGDSVAASGINREGYFEMRADKVGEDTTFAQVIRTVEEAGGSKAPIARLADKIAGVFVPAVMAIALLAFAVWMIYYLGSLIKDYSSVQKQYDAALKQRDELVLEVEQMANMLENSSDEDFIERAAREKLGYVYADEHKFIDISGN
jgi:P-type E1-E2 ATPase